MRAVNSNNASGSEAIVIAAVRWWASLPGSKEAVLDWLRDSPPETLNSQADGTPMKRTDTALGRRYVELHPELPAEVLRTIRADPGLRFAVDLAVEEHGSVPDKSEAQLEASREAVSRLILDLLAAFAGAIIKRSPDFGKVNREIDLYRKRLKLVKEVLET